MQTLLQDLRYGVRMLLKQKGLTSVAIFSLALGIGLNTAIFSIVNAVLIRPLPVVKQQNRLVWLRAPISYPDYLDYRSQAHSFEGMAAITGTQDFSVTSGSEPELVKGEYVTENYFDLLGVGASMGRAFVEEDTQTQTPVVILSEHLWRTRFAADANIVGRQISLNGFGFTVVGVMPKNFTGTEVGLNRELWLPLSMFRVLNPPAAARVADPGSDRFESRDSHWLAVFALLKPESSRDSAGSELTQIARRVAENYSGRVDEETLRSVQLLGMSGGMDPRDREDAPGIAILNETLAARLWPNEEALGKRISVAGPKGPFLEVVGVARNSKYRTLGETARPYVYLPLSQSYDPKMTLVVRTTGEPKAIAPIVREQIRTLNANLPIADVQTLREQLELTLLPSRIAAWTLGSFGALALLLAGIGIYGVVSYGAAQRTREIGVRMALGAKEKDVLGLVLWDGLIVIGAGLAIGLLLAAVATRVIASFLYGVGATDPLTFIAVPLLLGSVALLASYVPARRAVKVDPLVALRYE